MSRFSLPPRPLLIQRLLWTTVVLCCIIFALSMVMLGWTSLQMSPSCAGVTAIFAGTLLGLSSRDRKRRESDESNDKPTAPGAFGPSSALSRLHLPPVCRAITITLSIVLFLAWLATFGMSVTLVIFSTSPDSGMELVRANIERLPASYVELGFMIVQAGILLWLAVLCTKERSTCRSHFFSSQHDRGRHGRIHLVKIDMAVIYGAQGRLIHRLIWILPVLCATTIALTMVNLGFASFFLGPIAAVLSIILAITLIILTFKEKKAQGNHKPSEATPAVPSSAVEGAPPAPSTETPIYPPAQGIATPYNTLPCTSRLPTIICGLLLAIVWAAALGTSIGVQVAFIHGDKFTAPDYNLPVLIAEPVFIGLSGLVVACLSVLCVLQRRRLLGANQSLKWWQLGEYRV